MSGDESLRDEAVRLYRRYAVEIVERFNLCPWAARSRLEGRTKELVFQQKTSESLDPSLAALASLGGTEEADVALFIYPRLHVDLGIFETFARRLGQAYAERCAPESTPFVVAAFHPDPPGPALLGEVKGNPELLIPYLRRTPDPTLQWVRHAALERVRQGRPGEGTEFVAIEHLDVAMTECEAPSGKERPPVESLRRRIAHANVATIEATGIAELDRVYESIQRDRDTAYLRFA